ncbi:hypothetical protein BJF90_44925 [Pseudonocardia sp. CNS-004]|nr:hypothetical protein BJF90_44925 [Pseudonocardia sp. CNS-004]
MHQPLLVGRPAGLEHLVVDLAAVELHLVDAVHGGVERGTAHRAVHGEHAAHERGLPLPRRIGETDQLRGPPALGQEPRHHLPRRAPRRRHAVLARHADPDGVHAAGGQRLEGPLDQHRLAALDLHGCATVQLHLGAGLDPPGPIGLGHPGHRGRAVATVVRSVAYSAVTRTTDGTDIPLGFSP